MKTSNLFKPHTHRIPVSIDLQRYCWLAFQTVFKLAKPVHQAFQGLTCECLLDGQCLLGSMKSSTCKVALLVIAAGLSGCAALKGIRAMQRQSLKKLGRAKWALVACAWLFPITVYADQERPPAVENRLSHFARRALDEDLSSYYFVGKKCSLLFLGTRHTFDPKSRVFSFIDEGLDVFVPEEFLVEGGNWPSIANREDTIRQQGEMGYLSFLARRKKLPVSSFEPDQAEVVSLASKVHAPELVKMYLILRMIPQWREIYGTKNLSREVDQFINRARLPSSGPNSWQELELIVRREYGADSNWQLVDSNLRISGVIGSNVKEVDATINRYRNERIAEMIKASLIRNRRLVVAAGSTHLAALFIQLNDFEPICKN